MCSTLERMPLQLTDYLRLPDTLPAISQTPPWLIPQQLAQWVTSLFPRLTDEYTISDGVAVHISAKVEGNVTFDGPTFIGPDCHVKANAYFRGGGYLDAGVTIGPGCEIKSSYVGPGSAIAHFNYIGNSLIGANVNFEAGSITANHYNERADKEISVLLDGQPYRTGVTKFGALVGDGCRIGANAVLSPGTLLAPGTVVGRLELIRQI